jgi:hypothetical protein
MNFTARILETHLGSSALFGGAFFVTTFASDGFAQAMAAGAMASASWFAAAPLLRRVIGGIHGA